MRSLKAELNYFFALLIVVSALGFRFVAPVFHMILMYAGANIYSLIGSNVFVIFVTLLALAIIWKRNGGLLPVAIAAGCEKRYRLGGILAGIANVIVLAAVLISLLGYFFISGFGLGGGFLITIALMLAVPVNMVSIICIGRVRIFV
jgi:hypothetical protein